MASALELAINYDAIPLSKSIAKSLENDFRKIKAYDDWGTDLDNIVDPRTGFTALMIAAKNGNVKSVEVLINRSADVNFRSEVKGRCALHIAAKYGQLDVVKRLLHFGALVNIGDHQGITALMHACKAGHVELVLLLMEKGAGVNTLSHNGWNSVHFAAKYGHKIVLDALANAGAALNLQESRQGRTPLMMTAQFGRRESLRILLSRGVDVNTFSKVDRSTALMLACREGHKGIVSDLLDCGADVNMINAQGYNALLFAAAMGRRDTVNIIVSSGTVNMDFADETGEGATALIIAAKANQLVVLNLLLKLGANMNCKDIHGMTALAHAARNGYADIVGSLVDHGCDVNSQDATGSTALIHAASFGRSSVIIKLLNGGGNINIIDKKTLTAFDHAINNGFRTEFMFCLLSIDGIAKTKFISWLERECPKMIRGKDLVGNSSVYLNQFLYGPEGLYSGLYRRRGEYDAYLIHSLVMLAAAFRRSAESDPHAAEDMAEKLREVEDMLTRCWAARAMCADENVANSLLLPSQPIANGKYSITELAMGFVSGPVALYVDVDLGSMLTSKVLRKKLDGVFCCCVKGPQAGMSYIGSLNRSPWLRARYCPAIMFFAEGFFRLVFLMVVTASLDDPSNFNNKNAVYAFWLAMLFYEIGLMEEKRCFVTPSILFDFLDVERHRWRRVRRHFIDDIWKFFDFCAMVLIFFWMGADSFVRPGLLGVASIFLTVGLLRYICAFHHDFGTLVLTIVHMVKPVAMVLAIFAIIGTGFGICMHGVFREEIEEFSSPRLTFEALFQSVFTGQEYSAFNGSPRKKLGVLLITVFVLISLTLLLATLLAQIISNYPKTLEIGRHQHYLWFAKQIQTHLLIFERSTLCMIPPPLNYITVLLYFPDWLFTKLAKMAGLKYSTSLSGSVCDFLVTVILLPLAYGVQYFSVLYEADYYASTKLLCILVAPFVVLVNSAALVLSRIWVPAPTSLMLNNRRGPHSRYRIRYRDHRDWLDTIGVPGNYHRMQLRRQHAHKRSAIPQSIPAAELSGFYGDNMDDDEEKEESDSSDGDTSTASGEYRGKEDFNIFIYGINKTADIVEFGCSSVARIAPALAKKSGELGNDIYSATTDFLSKHERPKPVKEKKPPPMVKPFEFPADDESESEKEEEVENGMLRQLSEDEENNGGEQKSANDMETTVDGGLITLPSRMPTVDRNAYAGVADADGNTLYPPIFTSKERIHIFRDVVPELFGKDLRRGSTMAAAYSPSKSVHSSLEL